MQIGAVLTQGDYKLFLLTHHGQASGIIGGRFSEIGEYVINWLPPPNQPAYRDPTDCLFHLRRETTKVTDKLARVDLFFDSAHATPHELEECGSPTVKAVLWYGSFFVLSCPEPHPPASDCGGYFLYYSLLAGKPEPTRQIPGDQMAFTLTYWTDDPDLLPHRGSPELLHLLSAASRIVKEIKYK